MLSRRDFNKTLTAIALSSLASAPVRAAVDGDGLGDTAFLNRLTFGSNPEILQELAAMGQSKWLEAQLAMPANDAGLDERFANAELWIEYEEGENEDGKSWPAMAEGRALTQLNAAPKELVKLLDWELPVDYSERVRPTDEVIAAAFIRATHAPAQLREVMTQFWHEHFSVNSTKDEITSALYPPYDRLMRENAFGNFRTLLGQVARSPAMLHYLNNDDSYASPANENYARELLELHTLGQENYFNDRYENWHEVPGADTGESIGYIDADVYEVARALTGWSIGDGRYAGDDAVTKMTGEIAFVPGWHDPYQKRVLGRELSAFSTAVKDGDAVLDILAAHPGTARFVTRKMLRRLGMENPSQGYLDDIAVVFLGQQQAPDQIAQTIRAIVLHDEFSATPVSKLRRPFEFLIALYRVTGAQISPTGGEMNWRLEGAGWAQHQVRPPTGHSDKTEDWADTRTINGMVDLARNAHDNWTEITENILTKAPEGTRVISDIGRYWAKRFAMSEDVFSSAYVAMGFEPGDAIPDDPDTIEWINQILVTSAALGPGFLFR